MLFRIAFLVSLLLLVACGDDSQQSNNPNPPQAGQPDEPVWAPLDQASKALANDDLESALESLVPDMLRQRWRQDWLRWRDQPVDDEFRERFARIMAMLTEDDAERVIALQLGEQLRQLQTQKALMLPVLRGLLLNAAGVSTEMADQEPALQLLDGLLGWMDRTDFADSQRVEQLADLLVVHARSSDIRSWADVQALDFDQMMAQMASLVSMTRQVLLVYELDMAAALQQATFATDSRRGKQATVVVDLTLFGMQHRMELPMVRRETGWYLEAIDRHSPPEPPSLRPAGRDAP